MEPAEAKSSLIVNPGEDTLAGIAAILTGEAARLEINPIPVENRIELVERKARWSSGADKEQIAFCQTGLDRRSVERLKQLRLKQLADPGDLVPR